MASHGPLTHLSYSVGHLTPMWDMCGHHGSASRDGAIMRQNSANYAQHFLRIICGVFANYVQIMCAIFLAVCYTHLFFLLKKLKAG